MHRKILLLTAQQLSPLDCLRRGAADVAGTVAVMMSVDTAQETAEAKLAGSLPRRWRHVRSVARRARWVAGKIVLVDNLGGGSVAA